MYVLVLIVSSHKYRYLSVNDLATAAPREISNRVGKQAKKREKAKEAFDFR